jgi:hypothetical protein
MRRTTMMLPIAPSTPTTAYNIATTSPPISWLVDPAPVTKFFSNAVFIIAASSQRLSKPNAVSSGVIAQSYI